MWSGSVFPKQCQTEQKYKLNSTNGHKYKLHYLKFFEKISLDQIDVTKSGTKNMTETFKFDRNCQANKSR